MKALIIQLPVFPSWLIAPFNLHQPRHIAKTDLPQPDRRDPGGAAGVGADRVRDLFDLHVQHVGEDLAPDVRLGPTADDVDAFDRPPQELLDRLEQPTGVEGDAF